MTSATFAAGTSVSVEKTRTEIDTLLGKHGAIARGISVDDVAAQAVVMFAIGEHRYRLRVPLPKLAEHARGVSRRQGYSRTPAEQQKAFEQAMRERWRGAFLLLRAMLESVRLGILSAQDVLGGILVLPDGVTPQEGRFLDHDASGQPRAKELDHG